MKENKAIYAVVSTVLGMLSVALYFVNFKVSGIVISIFGIVFGIIAVVKNKGGIGILGLILSVCGFSINIFSIGVILYEGFKNGVETLRKIG